MVTITRHIIIINQMEHFPNVKFVIGLNMSFLVIPKSPKAWKKLKKWDWARSLKWKSMYFTITTLEV